MDDDQPQHATIVDADGKHWKSREIKEVVDGLSLALRQQGLKHGDTLALVAPNCVEFLIVYLAAMQSGVYLAPVNWHLSNEEMQHIISDSNAFAAIVHERVYTDATFKQCFDHLNIKISIGNINGFTNWRSLIDKRSSGLFLNSRPGRVTFYTSATTGKPCGVVHSLECAEFAPIRTVKYLELESKEKNIHLCTTMLYHGGGLMHATTALHMGHRVVLMDTWDPEGTLQLIEKHRVTTTFMAPTMFVRLLKLPDFIRRRYDLSSLIQVIHGSAPCPPQIKQQMIDWWGPIFWDCYNACEGQGTFSSPSDFEKYPKSVGKPFPGIAVKIIGDNGAEVPVGEVGDVYISSLPGYEFEYSNDPDKTRACHRGNYFTMGDVGYVNKEGYLFLVDRKKDTINSGGLKVFSAEIENVLLQHSAVLDCAVIAVKHDYLGETPKAFVELNPSDEMVLRGVDQKVLISNLFRFLRGKLAVQKMPHRIDVVNRLPRAPNGKIYKRLLKKSESSQLAGNSMQRIRKADSSPLTNGSVERNKKHGKKMIQ